MVRKFIEKGMRHINTIILTLYLFVVWASFLFLKYSERISSFGFFACLVGILAVIAVVTNRIIVKLSKIELAPRDEMRSRDKVILFSVSALICFGILLLWYTAVYPGSFSYDSYNQYHQAVSGSYNDWHPAWHTIVFFTFPLKLTGKVSGIVFFQILYFSLAMGYLCLFISEYAGVKWAAGALAYIMLNPITGNILMYPWKDVGFAIAGILSMIMAAELCLSKERGGRWRYVCILGIMLANATVFRHNGILFTAVLILALLFHVTRRQAIVLIGSFLLALFLIKVPIYKGFGVNTNVGNRVTETVGLPLTVIGNVAYGASWAIDEELAEFIDSLASPEQWEEAYSSGDFKSNVDLSVIEEAGRIKMVKLMFRCFQRATQVSLKGFIELTDMVYGIEGWVPRVGCYPVGENEYGIEYSGSREMFSFVGTYTGIIYDTVFRYLFYIGSSMVYMLFAMLSKCNLGKWKDWKKLFLCLPIFAYNFGTMLLLAGEDTRFFFISFLVCPVVVTIMFAGGKEGDHGK